MSLTEKTTAFENWWYREGSQPPAPGLDMEEHCKRMCKIAWEKSAQAERKQWSYAGIKIWGGDATFIKVFTEAEIKHARYPSELIKHSVQVGLDTLAAMADGSQP
jgi:hypothetical protein